MRHKHQGPDTKSRGPTPESWVQPSIGGSGEGPTDPVDQLPRGTPWGTAALTQCSGISVYHVCFTKAKRNYERTLVRLKGVYVCGGGRAG